MSNKEIKDCINLIGEFLGRRDISNLNKEEMEKYIGKNKVDILVLLGNSIPYTIECAVYAFNNNLCNKILINGGIGHSTELLRNAVRNEDRFKSINVDNRAEADIIFDIMIKIYNIPKEKIIVENKSTNCGDNAIKAVEKLNEQGISYESLLLIQDPTMQLRTYASFLKYVPKEVKVINYSPFVPKINEDLKLTNKGINGIWNEKRYLELIMGEIPRLKDDENGYGPKGQNFIEHIDIPNKIEEAYTILKATFNKDFFSRC